MRYTKILTPDSETPDSSKPKTLYLTTMGIAIKEHNKGLLRQFLPKKTNFKILKPKEVERAVNLINNRGGSITA
ncbi:MAG: hypothetical protein EWV83_07380 [Microcystis sp. M_OC_Ca_00000000_S217Cul]|nr:MAG: hypothetical protein EWV83_07380 [Microcystis sp. M_OC_Ca_00000000_S217Cul]TRT84752.1 MAG: hypothetical protein EWV66_19910 [Microcystis sp. M_OC_Ca_00000000_C217Col]